MSVFRNWQVSGPSGVTVGGTGTTPKYFQFPSGNFTSGTNPNGSGPSATSGFGQLAVPGFNELNAQRFQILAVGNFEVGSGGACPNVTIDMVANTGTVASPVWTIIATTGAVTAQNATGIYYPWAIEANLSGDTASGILSGTQKAVVDNTFVTTEAALTHTLSGLNFASDPVFGVAIRVTFSVSESGNSANMYQFQLAAF